MVLVWHIIVSAFHELMKRKRWNEGPHKLDGPHAACLDLIFDMYIGLLGH